MIALFFDTETTGFKSSTFTPEIVQIGALLQDTETKRVLGELSAIITPREEIPEAVSEIHHITTELAKQVGQDVGIISMAFQGLAEKADVIVAHNIEFDMEMVRDNWRLAFDAVTDKEWFCTMIESTDICELAPGKYHGKAYSHFKPPKLIEAYRHFYGNDFDNAHDAMADVKACRDIYFAILEHRKNG